MSSNGEAQIPRWLLPRGLYGRAALILFLPVVVVTLVVSIMFLQRHFEGVTRQMTSSMARELGFVAQRMTQSDNAALALLAGRAVATPLELSLQMPAQPGQDDQRLFYDFSGRVVIEELRATLPQIMSIDLATDDKRVDVVMEGRFGPYSVAFDRKRVSASNPHQLLVLMVFTSLLMSGIATVFLRNQLRPIRRLAHAAEEYGKGRILPYRPGGAVEVRSAGTAFLDMRNRLERQNEQRKMMMSGISHDLRTPLTRMRLGLSMIDEDDAEPLLQDVDDMQGMLDAFLDFAKGTAEGDAEPLDPHALMQTAVEDAQRAGRNVTLLPPEGDGTGTVRLRRMAILRAVDNLISNGVRYGARAEVSVMLTDKTLRIRVEDDGPGIPEDRRIEAVRPFSRLDPARNQNSGSGGVGLGLAIATDIARAHGGVLRLGSSDTLGGLRADIVIAR